MDGDRLNLLHPSLGLAFTADFKPRDLGETYMETVRKLRFMDAYAPEKTADNLPLGCDGCRVDLAGNEICPCKERDNG